MSFKDLDFKERIKVLGEIAEKAFEKYCYIHAIKSDRFGFELPNFDLFYKVPLTLRYMPDYIVEDGDTHFLVEVKGCGADGTFKLKKDNIETLFFWNKIVKVLFAFYDGENKQICYGYSLDTIYTILPTLEINKYGDNQKEYYLLPRERLEGYFSLAMPSIRDIYKRHGFSK